VASASVEEIDRLNILQATLLAMRRAVQRLDLALDEVLVDGNQCPTIDHPVRAVIKGDATVPAISAASILAKTARDRFMCELHALRPEYGFSRHKGYPTPEHLAALRRHGVSEYHRRSFAPVRALLADGLWIVHGGP
jgi:ribonuclease HII